MALAIGDMLPAGELVLVQALQAGAEWATAQEQVLTRFTPAAPDLDPAPLRAGLARGFSVPRAVLDGRDGSIAAVAELAVPAGPGLSRPMLTDEDLIAVPEDLREVQRQQPRR